MPPTGIVSFRDLVVWQLGMELALEVYRVTATFPRSEMYGLVAQSRRASTSIPSNLAEGHVRGTKVYLNHVRIALGSHAELDTMLELACRLGFVPRESLMRLKGPIDSLGRMLQNLAAALERRSTDPRSPRSPIPDP
jgi:four helix bundle protein